MAVNLSEPAALAPVPGVRLAASAAAIKHAGRDDLALLVFEPETSVAGVFTRSAFRAAPVVRAEARIRSGGVRALLINSGNANAATGEPGLADADALCASVAGALGVDAASVAPFSTGVIGERLPVARMQAMVPELASTLAPDRWLAAARAIMTTDTVAKAGSVRGRVDGRTVTATGMAKGSGMIHPDMATMLAFVCTDASVTRTCLDALVRQLAERSFNRITVDGDTSTNDAFVLAATGVAGGPPIEQADSEAGRALLDLLSPLCVQLAQAIVRDGEGATKFVTVTVEGGRNADECLAVAWTVAHSPLVKTALFASDPNWGRLAMAIGRAGVEALDPSAVQLWFDEVRVMTNGLVDPGYTEAAGAAALAGDEPTLRIDLGRGTARETVWTTDLSYEYVRINAEYRT